MIHAPVAKNAKKVMVAVYGLLNSRLMSSAVMLSMSQMKTSVATVFIRRPCSIELLRSSGQKGLQSELLGSKELRSSEIVA